MKCNRCGQEFGKGNICQHCGADKVAALGEFSGYSTPKKRATKKSRQMIDNQAATPSPQHVEPPISTQICWKCGEIIPLGNYCPVCGQELFRKCPQCGNQYSSQYHICPNCGTNHLEYEKAQAKAAADAIERKRKEVEARKRLEQEKIERQKRLQKEKELERSVIELKQKADYAHQLIHQRNWVTSDQRKTLLPLFTEFWNKIKSIPKVIDYQTDLSGVRTAWEMLDQNNTFIQIKNEENRRIKQEKARKAEQAAEEKRRIEEEHKRRLEELKLQSQIKSARERRETSLPQSGFGREDLTLGILAVCLLFCLSFFVSGMVLTAIGLNSSKDVGINAECCFLFSILFVVIRRGIRNHRLACTEHLCFWRGFSEKTSISIVVGTNASISFEDEVQYIPEKASIHVNQGVCFTIKSSSHLIKEIKFINDNTPVALDSNNGQISNEGDTWHGYSTDIRFKANASIDLARIDIMFDSPITKE